MDASHLNAVLMDQFSPQAIVAIAAHIQSANVNDESVNAELRWFHGVCIKIVGVEQFNRIANEIGA